MAEFTYSAGAGPMGLQKRIHETVSGGTPTSNNTQSLGTQNPGISEQERLARVAQHNKVKGLSGADAWSQYNAQKAQATGMGTYEQQMAAAQAADNARFQQAKANYIPPPPVPREPGLGERIVNWIYPSAYAKR